MIDIYSPYGVKVYQTRNKQHVPYESKLFYEVKDKLNLVK